ncbi:MAG: T9SS type A sorting domain-containing protein [Crocinitomicaceae bacterium]|nr:T9SS type A sorting domain-containing protein [Crocinitomicaceae bacterium]
MRLLVALFIVGLVSLSGNAQIEFYKVFSDNGADAGQGIVQLADSSYVVTGWSSSFDGGSSQAILLKLDSLGNYQWSEDYGGSESDAGRRVLYKQGFGFFICGYTNSIGNGGFDYYLVKVDESGAFEWEQSYGGAGWEKVHDAALTRDTGTIMVGETSSNPIDDQDMYIVRTNSSGDTLWTKTFGGLGDDYLSCIRQQNDSVFVIGGRKFIEDSSMVKGYLAGIKDDGTILWEDTMGVIGDYWINDIVLESNRWIAIGGTSGDSKNGVDFYQHVSDIGGADYGGFELPDGGDNENMLITTYGALGDFYIAYENDTYGVTTFEGGPDLLVAKYFNNISWANLYFKIAHVDPDIGGQIISTSDGGAIITGYTTGVVSGGNELFVAKIGPNDLMPDPETNMILDNIVTIDENELVSSFAVYPNPAIDVLSIRTENADYEEIRLLNSTGELVKSIPFSLIGQLNVSELPSGWYILEVVGKATTARKKVVINR